MCPIWQPDFENTHATAVVHPKGEYELVLGKPAGFAYDKEDKDKAGAVVGSHKVVGVNITPKIVGVIGSDGKLVTDKEPAGLDTERVRLYLHSDGAMKMTKRILLAVFGFTPKQEEDFNKWYKKQDFGLDIEDNEAGDGFNVTLHSGWNQLEGRHVKCSLDKALYTPENGGDPQDQQRFNSWSPVK